MIMIMIMIIMMILQNEIQIKVHDSHLEAALSFLKLRQREDRSLVLMKCHYCDLHNDRPKTAETSATRFRDTPRFKFQAVFIPQRRENGATNPGSNAEKWSIIIKQFAVVPQLVDAIWRPVPRLHH